MHFCKFFTKNLTLPVHPSCCHAELISQSTLLFHTPHFNQEKKKNNSLYFLNLTLFLFILCPNFGSYVQYMGFYSRHYFFMGKLNQPHSHVHNLPVGIMADVKEKKNARKCQEK